MVIVLRVPELERVLPELVLDLMSLAFVRFYTGRPVFILVVMGFADDVS